MINIAYIANPNSIHDCKWINKFSEKYNVIVISSNYRAENSFLYDRVKVYNILPPTFPFKNIIKRISVINNFRNIIKNEKIDIIHSMYAFPNSFWVNFIKFDKHIITTRGSDILVDYINLFNSNTLKNKVINKYFIKQFNSTFNNASFVTSTSKAQQQIIKGFIKDYNKLKLIRTGIDVEQFLNIENKEINNDKTIIFSPRSMKPIYNIDLIIDSFYLYNKKNIKSKLLLINDSIGSDYSKYIIRKIKELKIENECVILPKQTKAQMFENYYKSDIVISIPTTDGTPNTVLEAMLTKKPVIVGPFKLDNLLFSNIFSIDKLDSNVLVKKINSIINMDKLELKKIIEKNYQIVVDNANLGKSILYVDSLYKELINAIKK